MKKMILALCAMAQMWLPAEIMAADKLEIAYQGLNTTHPTTLVTNKYFEEIAAASSGNLIFKFLNQNSIVKGESVYPALKDGTLECGMYSPNYFLNALPYSQAVAFPWIARDAAHAARVIEALKKEIPELAAEQDTKYVLTLGLWGTDRCALISNTVQVKSPADIKGKRVLTWSPGTVEEIKAWGGTPVMISNTDAYVGLQRGLGDVCYGQMPMMNTLKLYEVAKYITVLPPSSMMGLAIGLNRDFWEEDLSDSMRDAMRKSFANLTLDMGEAVFQAGNADLDFFRSNGNEVLILSPDEVVPFKDLSEPVIRAFYLDRLKQAGIADPGAYIDLVQSIAAKVD